MARFDGSHRDDLAAQRLQELFLAYRKSVISYARRRAPAESVDDVVAETFLIAWRRLEHVPVDSPLPWLLAVARNLIANQHRGAGRRDALSLRLQETTTVEAIDPPSVQETGPVAVAMARLGEKDREALELVAGDGLQPREAAAVLGELPGTFRVRLHRAKRRLGRLLEEQREQLAEPGQNAPENQGLQPSTRPLKAKETTP